MEGLAGRKKADKKPELTEDEKFVQGLTAEVATYLTIHKAAYFGIVKNLEKLLDGKVAIDALEPESGNSALIIAARNGNLEAARLLIEKGRANVNLAGYGGLTALHHACKNDETEMVELLLDVGKCSVNIEDDAGNTPASLSCRMGNLQCLELVLHRGATIDHANKKGSTPFGVAVLNGRMAIVDWMIKKSNGGASGAPPTINLSHVDKEGNTPLHYAASCGYIRVVRQLLTANCKTNIENANNEKAEDVAFNEAIKTLIQTAGEAIVS